MVVLRVRSVEGRKDPIRQNRQLQTFPVTSEQVVTDGASNPGNRYAAKVIDRYLVVPASYVIIRSGDKVLLQLRRGTGYMDGYWATAAAGHVEPGESIVDAARREALEELDIEIA